MASSNRESWEKLLREQIHSDWPISKNLGKVFDSLTHLDLSEIYEFRSNFCSNISNLDYLKKTLNFEMIIKK